MRDSFRHNQIVCVSLACLLLATMGASVPAAAPARSAALDADLLLRGGTIHDGSGAPPVTGDVAVRDGRIVAIGKIAPGKIGRTIDCRGLIVAPGFIDLHTHSDSTLAKPGHPPCLNYLLQGCTTMSTGNCGGARPTEAFLDDIDRAGAGVNMVHLVGHGSVRRAVLRGERRPPTPDELERMKSMVAQAMRDGAWGMSTGLIYPPGSYARTDEIVALARVVAAHGGIYVSHIRNEADHLLDAVAEAIRVGKESGAPVHISHFKSMEIPNWGKIRDAAALVEKARAQGLTVTADQYPYTANSHSLADAVLPEAEVDWCKPADLAGRMAADPAFAALVRRVIAGHLERSEDITIATGKKFPQYVGRTLRKIAAEEGIDRIDLVLKIVAQENPHVVNHSMSEADVRWAMALPWVATGSDGAVRVPNPDERHHPRNFGAIARKIGQYAIADGVIPLAHAIRSASGLPADIFRIPERGYIRPGYHADIVVLDPADYRDRATFDSPQRYATGVRYVFIAGQAAVDEGRPSPTVFGRALRHRSPAQSTPAAPAPPAAAAPAPPASPSAATPPAPRAPFDVRVEAEEIVCRPPPYEATNNGSGMFWGSGSPQIARVGARLFVSAFEHVPGVAPLNNARWALHERATDGWRLRRRDLDERTREPSPLAVSHAGRLLLSINPTLAPPIPAPDAAPDKEMRADARVAAARPRVTGGPARPAFLEFDPADAGRIPTRLEPPWKEAPRFTEHSYRTFAADGARGEFVLFQNIGSTHSQWALLEQNGAWKTGRLVWPEGEDRRYAPYHDERARVNYPNVILANRQAHFIGTSPYNIWKRIDPLKTETWGREKWGARMRKLHYAYTPDIGCAPFTPWVVVADTMDDGGTLILGDSWLAPDGRVHAVWMEEPIHPRLRALHFPDIKRDWRLWYGVLKSGQVIETRTLFSGGETTGPIRPIGRPRFHVAPGRVLYLLYSVVGTTPATTRETGDYAVRIDADGTVSPAVRLPLRRPLTGTFFTATPRSGHAPSDVADLLIADTIDGKPVARYARLRFVPKS